MYMGLINVTRPLAGKDTLSISLNLCRNQGLRNIFAGQQIMGPDIVLDKRCSTFSNAMQFPAQKTSSGHS